MRRKIEWKRISLTPKPSLWPEFDSRPYHSFILTRQYSMLSLFLVKAYHSCYFFSEFKTGKTPILLATDVAARGLGKKLKYDR